MIMFNGIHLAICFGCFIVGGFFGYMIRWSGEEDRKNNS